MKTNKIDKFIEKALTKMFQAVGAKYSMEYCKQENWFTSYTWNSKQIENYKKWFVSTIRTDLKITKKSAELEWGYFFLQFGWKQKF